VTLSLGVFAIGELAERVRLTRAIHGPRPSLMLGARYARPIRLSCRIVELSEFVHEPCSDP